MADPSLFYISLLELIPRAPDKITVRELMKKLEEDNPNYFKTDLEFKAETKRVQRALSNLLFKYNQIGCIENGRTKEYSWSAMAEPLMFPSLDSNTALILALASHYLDPILPDTSVKALNRLFMRARSRLASKANDEADKVSVWKDKVAVLDLGIPRELPRTNAKVESVIYDALLNEKVVKIKYLAWGKSEATEQILSPQGLFLRGQLVYIFAVNHKYKDNPTPLSYLLLRIQEAAIINEPFCKIQGFKAQKHLDVGSFGVPLDKKKGSTLLRIKLDNAVLNGVVEQPLSKDQRIQKDNEQWSTLSATVNYTLELKQWLRSQAHHIEVIEPAELRQEMIDSIEKLISTYKK